jgi:hypothetical protein
VTLWRVVGAVAVALVLVVVYRAERSVVSARERDAVRLELDTARMAVELRYLALQASEARELRDSLWRVRLECAALMRPRAVDSLLAGR